MTIDFYNDHRTTKKKIMKNTTLLFLLLCLSYFSSQAQSMIDAAFAISDEEAEIIVFIKDDKIIFYSMDTDETVPAMQLDEVFEGFPFKNIDAAFNYNNEKIYFFSESEYIRIDTETGIIDEGYPKSTSSQWTGIDFKKIDAAVSWNNGKSYFFSQSDYSRCDTKNQAIDKSYPSTINDRTWPGLEYQSIDAAFTTPGGYTYFFKGDKYVRFDNEEDRVEDGYPSDLSDFNGLVEALNGELPEPNPDPNPDPTPQPNNEGMEFFHGTWDEVLTESKATGKLVFVDAYTSWCGPCKWMSKSVFPDNRVGTVFNKNFINYKFDMERGEGPAFAKKYRVEGYPSLYFIDSKGNVVQKQVGAMGAEDLISVGKKVAKKHGSSTNNNSTKNKKNALYGSGGNEH